MIYMELIMESFWNKTYREKGYSSWWTTSTSNYTQLFSLGLLLVVFQMSSEIPLVSVIFRTHVTLETGTVNTAPLDVIKIWSTMNEFFATGFALGITSLRGRNVRALMLIQTSNGWELLGTFCTWKHHPDSMCAVMYLQTRGLSEVFITWFAVVLLLPHVFRPDVILQGLCPHLSFVTNVTCAVVFGHVFKNCGRFTQLCNFACVYSMHS